MIFRWPSSKSHLDLLCLICCLPNTDPIIAVRQNKFEIYKFTLYEPSVTLFYFKLSQSPAAFTLVFN